MLEEPIAADFPYTNAFDACMHGYYRVVVGGAAAAAAAAAVAAAAAAVAAAEKRREIKICSGARMC